MAVVCHHSVKLGEYLANLCAIISGEAPALVVVPQWCVSEYNYRRILWKVLDIIRQPLELFTTRLEIWLPWVVCPPRGRGLIQMTGCLSLKSA